MNFSHKEPSDDTSKLFKNKKKKNVSIQQDIIMRTLINNNIINKLTGQPSIFQLSGLPGSGKTFVVRNIIKTLISIGMINSKQVLICCKNNTAVGAVHSTLNLNMDDGDGNNNNNDDDDDISLKDVHLKTFHTTFSYPVIKEGMDIQQTLQWVPHKIMANLNMYVNTELLIIDEYMTMKSSEIIYIDALFRIVRFKPAVPFGGLTVIFLGDNRQNSAVLSTSSNGINDSERHIANDYMIKIIDLIFGSSSDWIKTQSRILNNNRIKNLKRHIQEYISVCNNEVIGKICENDTTLNYGNTRNTKNMLSEAIQKIALHEEHNIGELFSALSGEFPLEKLILDCFIMRLHELSHYTESDILENTNAVLAFVHYAMLDVVAFARDKFYVLPTMAEEVEGEEQLLIPRREMMNILINEGNGPNFLDNRYNFKELEDIKRIISSSLLDDEMDLRSFFVSVFKEYGEHVNNLMACKDYQDFEDYVSRVWDILVVNNTNKDNNNNNKNNNNTFCDDNYKKNHQSNISNNIKLMSDYDDIDNDSDYGDDWCGGGGEEENNDDYTGYGSVIGDISFIPEGINPHSTIPFRLLKTIELQKIIKNYDCSFPGSADKLKGKARYWFFLNDLIKRELTKRQNSDKNIIIMQHDNNDNYDNNPQLGKKEPYWLRAFVTPNSKTINKSDNRCLPAYSIYLSLKSMSFTLNSLKRIIIDKHPLGLTYAMAIKDLTSAYSMFDLRSLVDFNDKKKKFTNGRRKPILKSIELYFETIFPTMIKNFLYVDQNLIKKKIRDIYSESDKDVISRNLDKKRYSKNVRLLATEMISNFIYEDKVDSQNKINTENGMSTIDYFKKIREDMIKENNNNDNKTNDFPPKKKIKCTPIDMTGGTLDIEKVNNMNSHVGNSETKNNNNNNKDYDDDDYCKNRNSAIILTKTNIDKNDVSYLVSKVILERLAIKNKEILSKDDSNNIITTKMVNDTSLKKFTQSHVFRTLFSIDNIFLNSKNIYATPNNVITRILSTFTSHYKISNTPFINKSIDYRFYNCRDCNTCKKILYNIKNNITKVDEVLLFVGQKVYFTHTNGSHDFGTDVHFYTQDTGTIVDINIPYKNSINKSEITVHVSIDRLAGQIAKVKSFTYVEGKIKITFLPIASLLSMTIFSCQGTTLKSTTTLINPSRLTTQEAYVALTRNDNVKDIKIVTSMISDIDGLLDLKRMLYPDRSRLYPIGVFGKRLGSLKNNHILNNDEIEIIQRFLLNKSDNHLFFNQRWFETVESELEADGNIETALNTLESFFIFKNNHKGIDDNNNDLCFFIKTFDEITLDLFYTCYLSLINFNRVYDYQISKGSKEFTNFISKGHGPTHLNKKPPIYISPVIPRKSMSKIFFDLFPHSRAVVLFQVYANFIFFVYELIDIKNIAYAFSSSPSPLSHIAFGCPRDIDLNWESDRYRAFKAFLNKDNNKRNHVTENDIQCDEILKKGIAERFTDSSGGSIQIGQEHIAAAILHNLRRSVQNYKANEIAGTGIHGAIVISVGKDKLSNIASDSKEEIPALGIRFNNNIFSLLHFNTRLAGASGVEKKPFPPLIDVHASIMSNYELMTPNYMITCGKAYPFKSIQFPIFMKKKKCDQNIEGDLLNIQFISKVLDGKKRSSFALFCYDSVPSGKLGMDTIETKELMCNNNVGILRNIKILRGLDTLNKKIRDFIKDKNRIYLDNHMIYISIRLM